MRQRQSTAISQALNGNRHFLPYRIYVIVILLSLPACPSPTKTDVSIQSQMPLAPGEAIVLFPSQRGESWEFADCLQSELKRRGVPGLTLVDTKDFQNALFPWFELEHVPKTAQDMEDLLARTIVRNRIASLNVRYLFDLVISSSADGFPGMLCGGGYAGAGCLGAAWADNRSELTAIVWDLKKARITGNLSVSSSGESIALGVIIPIVFTAYTEESACEALAMELTRMLNNEAGTKTSDQ